MKRLRGFVLTYAMAVYLLHAWGESAWPWHVRDVWPEARQEIHYAQSRGLIR